MPTDLINSRLFMAFKCSVASPNAAVQKTHGFYTELRRDFGSVMRWDERYHTPGTIQSQGRNCKIIEPAKKIGGASPQGARRWLIRKWIALMKADGITVRRGPARPPLRHPSWADTQVRPYRRIFKTLHLLCESGDVFNSSRPLRNVAAAACLSGYPAAIPMTIFFSAGISSTSWRYPENAWKRPDRWFQGLPEARHNKMWWLRTLRQDRNTARSACCRM